MLFSLTISTSDIIILSVSLILSIALVCWYYLRFGALSSFLNNNIPEYSDEQPGVSIIVYALNDANSLANNLPIILNQKYPQYEVIVVNDNSTDNSKDIVGELELTHKNLYQTFIPGDTRNLSRKKLAITIGIKAAKYDIVLTTTAYCCPKNEEWLAHIMRNFTPDTDIVIGYSHSDFHADKGIGKWYRDFDSAISALQYLSYAVRKKTFRGDGNNLAYRKQLFFDNKGFSKSLNLHYGDDDLFVNEVSTPENTKVEISHPSQMMVSYYNSKTAHRELKLRYDFTAQYIHTRAKASSSFMSVLFWTLTIITGVGIGVSWPNLFTSILLAIFWLNTVVFQTIWYRRLSDILESRKLLTSVPIFYLWRPLVNLRYRLVGHNLRKTNFTWQRKK